MGGLDIGPATIAAVSEAKATLVPFCPELDLKQAETRVVQRKLDRGRGAANPEAFDKDKTIKKGARLKKTKGYRRDQAKLAELKRKQKAQRKTSHGTLANQILSLGTTINTEKLSHKGWQKGLFGKSVGSRAPGTFVETLRRKAESAGGAVNEFPARNKLSQTCHCGQIHKKELSERWHMRERGAYAQRDLYSAFLAMNAAGNELDICQARKAWPGAEPLPRDAMSSRNRRVSARPPCSGPGSERFASRRGIG